MLKQPSDYAGDRTSKDLAESVTRMLTDVYVSRIRNLADLKELRGSGEKAGKPQVLLFTDKEAVTSLYKGLSMQLRRGLEFGLVHSAAEEVVREFGVESFPTVLVLKVGGGVETYTGESKAPALREYLLGFMSAETTEAVDDAAADANSGDKAAAWSFVRQVEGLSELGSLEAREDLALMALHGAEGEDGCKAARQAFLAAAGEMQAVVDTLLVSVPAADLAHGSEGAKALTRIGVAVSELVADPCELQVILLPFGKDKADLDMQLKYTGPPEGKELQRWVTGEIPNLVSELNDMTASEFLTTDPSEGKFPVTPKVLLFTNKDEAPGVFRALALALRGRANMAFAWVQANSRGARGVMESFKPPRVPALLVVMPTIVPDENNPSEPKLRFGMQPYFGSLKFTPMKSFLEQLASQFEMSSGVVHDPDIIQKTLPQITNQAEFQEHCTEPAGMCLLALLDGKADGFADEHKNLLAAAMQQARSGGALHFAWLDALKHKSVMQAFGVMGSDLPVLVALSAKRLRFAALQHSPGAEGSTSSRLRPEQISRFLSDVLSAKIKTEPLQALPEIREGDSDSDAADGGGAGAGADGADGAAVEEFDLSDILSEEVEGGAVGGTKAERLREIEEQLKAEEEARKAAEKKTKAKKKKSKKSKKSKAASEEL
ncbi:hypothetical protein Vafri_17880 [Volvox africanus]|uniref:protein disulfide-isomerase n=1 Tax=Volvox africanus TaxID=51714 RepID=A0A8J4BM42_9CHLO|nr:hypothetical protein Vafri_17880 [Volvox africanus]